MTLFRSYEESSVHFSFYDGTRFKSVTILKRESLPRVGKKENAVLHKFPKTNNSEEGIHLLHTSTSFRSRSR